MRKVAHILLLLSGVYSLSVVAQDLDLQSAALSDLDFSTATISQAGPDALYIRSVQTDQGVFSFLLQPVEPGGLTVTRIVPEDENLLPPSTILDFATITPFADGTIRIDGVIIDGSFYSGALAVDSSGQVTLSQMLTLTDDPQIREARLEAVASLIDAPTEEEFRSLLEQEQARLEALVQQIRAERDELATENQVLRDERDELEQRLEEELAAQPGTVPAAEEGPSQDEFDELSEQRDSLAQNVQTLTTQNSELQSQIAELRDQIASLQSENATLQEDLAVMTDEVDRLQELVAAYESAAAAAPEPQEWEFPGDYVRTADLRAAAAAVANELAALSEQIRSLEDEVAEVAARPVVASRRPGPADEPDSQPAATRDEAEDAVEDAERAERLARLQGEVAALEEENAALRRDRDQLERRILDEILNNSLVALMRERMATTLVSGFGSLVADTGRWEVAAGRVLQQDPDAFFAKASISAVQENVPTLYSVQVRSLDEGWVGVGLHLFVDNVRARRGYGMGSSLLVWLTRDPATRGSAQTYLQVYRSDDDVNMERVLDAAIPESVADSLNLEILYEPQTQYITVAVNGQDKVRYRTWFGIDTGVELALRSLGRAEFTNFQVMRADSDSETTAP
jgi:septal ring factor EnvC (AmiA/AmiB activator)